MDASEKINYIKNELDKSIREFNDKRKYYRRIAFWLKIASIFLASVITILLGLKVDDAWEEIFKNVALVFGAGVTIINSADAFFDYRSLWIGRTNTMLKMLELKRDFSYYVSGVEHSDVETEKLDGFLSRFNQILKEDAQNWIKLRDVNMS